jgi:hypothetical protein
MTMSVRSLSTVVGAAFVGVVAALPLGAPAVAAPADDARHGHHVAAPAALAPPAGNVAAFDLLGDGVQNYECVNGAWAPAGPSANLLKHRKAVGIHYRSASGAPAWQSTRDGSLVTATVSASAPSDRPDSVPQLLLAANSNLGGAGTAFGDVTYVQRLATRGGVAPAGACDATVTARAATPYTAVYRFFKAG